MIEHFHRPGSVREAVALMRKLRGRAAFLAGGTYLNSLESNVHPEHAISLEELGLDRVERRARTLAIGARCTLQQLMDDRKVPAALRMAIAQIVPRNIRNAATIGGNVASSWPQSDVLPMLVALEAKLVIAGQGPSKTVRVEEYVSRRVPGLITTIVLPLAGAGRVAAVRNMRASANAHSTVTVAVAATVARGIVRNAVIAIGGVAAHVVRASAAEKALEGNALPDADVLQALVSRPLKPAPSPIGSAVLRKYEAGALVALALRDAIATKGGRK